MMKILEIRNMSIGHGKRTLLNGISFDVAKRDCIMLCGANGSGKTTLLKAISTMSDKYVMIPARIPKVAGFTTREFIRISCFRQSDMAGRLSSEDEAAIERAMGMLDISRIADQDITTLSDGEFQKAGIAAALVRQASLIMLDEPTAFLDAENRISVLMCLRELCDKSDTAVIFSTHDLEDGLRACSKVFAIGADGVFRSSSHDMKAAVRSIFRSF